MNGVACNLGALPAGSTAVVLELPAGPLEARLASLGLAPGTVVELQQKTPTLVVRVRSALLAMEPEIGARILVRQQGQPLTGQARGA